jgi:pimeloyl-ACP methyl ester carboxylesterase
LEGSARTKLEIVDSQLALRHRNQACMKLKFSEFKAPAQDLPWFDAWVARLEAINQRKYQRQMVDSLLGKTLVWSLDADRKDLPTLVIFPGFRTSPLFWDLDGGLDLLLGKCRIFLVETNGQPNPSDGHSPAIKGDGYGHWAGDLIGKLGIQECYVAGGSFGGLVCMKLCLTHPQLVKAAFLLNPGCLQSFSMNWKNLSSNLRPLLFPKRKNVIRFLENAVLCRPNHTLPENRMELLIDYELFAIRRYKDKTQKPYFMKDELQAVKNAVYLLLGDQDILFPTAKSKAHAEALLSGLKPVEIFPNVGHGIETFRPAIARVGQLIL